MAFIDTYTATRTCDAIWTNTCKCRCIQREHNFKYTLQLWKLQTVYKTVRKLSTEVRYRSWIPTESMERSPMEMGLTMLGDSCFLPTIVFSCFPVAYSKQPKGLTASEDYHAVLSTNVLCWKNDLTTGGDIRSGHTERGLPQRIAVSVRCGMLHSKQTLLTIIFWKQSSSAIKRNHSHFDS